MLVAEIVAVSPEGSGVGQCVLAVVGARQVASHHARAGAAAATAAMASTIRKRCNINYFCSFFCSAARRSLERSPPRMFVIA